MRNKALYHGRRGWTMRHMSLSTMGGEAGLCATGPSLIMGGRLDYAQPDSLTLGEEASLCAEAVRPKEKRLVYAQRLPLS